MADWPEVEAVDGAQDALRRLRPRYRLIVATNADDSGEPTCAPRSPASASTSSSTTSSRPRRRRPQARLAFYRAALLRAGARGLPLAPARAVMVGDARPTTSPAPSAPACAPSGSTRRSAAFPDGAAAAGRRDPQARRAARGGRPPRRRHAGEAVPQAAQGRRGRRGGGRGQGGLQGPARRDGGRGLRGVGRRGRPRRRAGRTGAGRPYRSAGRTTRREAAHGPESSRRAGAAARCELGADAATLVDDRRDRDRRVGAHEVPVRLRRSAASARPARPTCRPVAVTRRLLVGVPPRRAARGRPDRRRARTATPSRGASTTPP